MIEVKDKSAAIILSGGEWVKGRTELILNNKLAEIISLLSIEKNDEKDK